jgi:hypothetical protein
MGTNGEPRPRCQACGREIDQLGYRLQALGTADDLMKIVDMGIERNESIESRAEAGSALAEGWNMCIPCLAEFAILSCSLEERIAVAERLGRLLEGGPETFGP